VECVIKGNDAGCSYGNDPTSTIVIKLYKRRNFGRK